MDNIKPLPFEIFYVEYLHRLIKKSNVPTINDYSSPEYIEALKRIYFELIYNHATYIYPDNRKDFLKEFNIMELEQGENKKSKRIMNRVLYYVLTIIEDRISTSINKPLEKHVSDLGIPRQIVIDLIANDIHTLDELYEAYDTGNLGFIKMQTKLQLKELLGVAGYNIHKIKNKPTESYLNKQEINYFQKLITEINDSKKSRNLHL